MYRTLKELSKEFFRKHYEHDYDDKWHAENFNPLDLTAEQMDILIETEILGVGLRSQLDMPMLIENKYKSINKIFQDSIIAILKAWKEHGLYTQEYHDKHKTIWFENFDTKANFKAIHDLVKLTEYYNEKIYFFGILDNITYYDKLYENWCD